MINEDIMTQRRNFCVRNLVRDFLLAFKNFKEIKNKYKKVGIEHNDFDILVGNKEYKGLLNRIRDLCPKVLNKEEFRVRSLYFNSIINFLYHDVAKLKELCNFIEYHDIILKNIKEETSEFDNKDSSTILTNCQKFLDTAFLELKGGFNRVDKSFSNALEELKCFLAKEKSNTLLIRFLLIEGRTLLEDIWGEDGTISLLIELFPEGLDEAYCFAAEDYFEGSWYDKAKKAYMYALSINPDCEHAKDGLRLLGKRLEELAQIQEKERDRFKKVKLS